MNTRRTFLNRLMALGATSVLPAGWLQTSPKGARPVVISTWNNIKANEAAWRVLQPGGYALDAVEQGVMIPEADPDDHSVGYGGFPDRDGNVTLDACIQDEAGRCGAVAFLEHIKHPIQVARLVMEKTPHWMLAGAGALQFAKEQGFKEENLLTDEARTAWENWKTEHHYTPVSEQNHDTIGMVALDAAGRLCGACTTSGAAWKMRGRVGDSPIIGAGLFVDNEVGAASATGLGEMVVRVCGSHTVVEYLRRGFSPEEACRLTLKRLIQKWPEHEGQQVGFLALTKDGRHGGYSLRPGFSYALADGKGVRNVPCKSLFSK